MRSLRLDTTRALQVGFSVLFAACGLQVSWWLFDEIAFTTTIRDERMAEALRDAEAAQRLVARGASSNEVLAAYPDLARDRATGEVIVDPVFRARLDEERWRRINRFVWESGFFLVVLVLGTAVLVRALRKDRDLRRRQQNFMAAVSHEFKSPLASIKLAAETLEMRELDAPARSRLAARVTEDVDRLQLMVSNILDASRIEDARHEEEATVVPLDDLLGDIVDEVGPRARSAGAEIGAKLEGAASINGDPVAVRSVVRNLLDNAIKAVEERGHGYIEVRSSLEGHEAVVSVEDDGIGFRMDEASRLFEKFYRPGNEMRRTSRGSGLGLYIVKRLVELQGGKVEARSAGPGRGALFSVRWPVVGRAGSEGR